LSRKGLYIFIAVAALIIAAGVALLVFRPKPGGTGSSDQSLSFKPFTLNQLLHLQTQIDAKTCGTPLHSAQLEQIEQRVVKLRELPLVKPVVFTALSEACLRADLLQSQAQETPSSESLADQKLLAALGLIPEDMNLEETVTNVLTEQIAGSYDTKGKDITVIKGKGLGGVIGAVTMAHEITHALQDQNFNLDKPPLENKAYNGDNDLAIQSLVEGDATSTMTDYGGKYVTLSELANQNMSSSEVSSSQLDQAPVYIRRSLLFPYEEGLTFVRALKQASGESDVDRAFRDPPLSTEQIMHPEKYFLQRDNPIPVPLPDISADLGKGWKLINSDTMGEFDVSVWFEQYGGLLASKDVADGWGGNTIQYYQGPGKSYALVNDFVWDTPLDARQFFTRYAELVEKRFGGKAHKLASTPASFLYSAEGQYFYCGISGNGTLAVQATDLVTLNKAVSKFPQFPPAPPTGGK
jgi:hypothetical protein